MLKRTVPLLVIVALALPAIAVAKKADLVGPAALLGHGPVRGELKSETGPKRVGFRLARGLMRFTDLGGDMNVVCRGNGPTHAGLNDDGKLVVQCSGQTNVVVSASAFRFGGKARRYAIHIPDGVGGTVQGEYRLRGDESPHQERPTPERPSSGSEPGRG
jgi:hypothetical protein